MAFLQEGIVIDILHNSETTLAHEVSHYVKQQTNEMHENKSPMNLDADGSIRSRDACPDEDWCKKVSEFIKSIQSSL